LRNKYNNEQVKGLAVEVRNGDFNAALRRFKKKVQEAGIIQEVRDRQEFVKPSKKRAKAKAAGIARWKKKLSKQHEIVPMPGSKVKRNY
jgi:small subunit ribosomal protein S21|tara:strand:+ start:529 stop:795 length:267 start_codon:yes stop_codon:yes gene_type:complete